MKRNHLERLRNLLIAPQLILGMALIIHLFLLFSYAPWFNEKEKLVSAGDAASYHLVAKIILKQPRIQEEFPEADIGLEVANRPIGYPLLLAVTYKLFGEHPLLMIIFQIGLNLLGCGVAMVALRKIFGGNPVAGAIGGWVYALNPLLPDYACQVLTEVPFVTSTAVLIYLLSILHENVSHSKMWTMLIIGVLVGVATLLRASMLLFAAPLGVLAVWHSARSWSDRFRLLIVYALGVGMFILAWGVYNKLNYNTWRLTLSGEIHLIHMIVEISSGKVSRQALLDEAAQLMQQDGRDYEKDFFGRSEYYRKVIEKYITKYPRESFRLILRGMWKFWRDTGEITTGPEWLRDFRRGRWWPRVYHATYLLLIITGLFIHVWRKENRIWLYYFLIAAFYFTLVAGWGGYSRYRLQVFAFSLPIAVTGAIWLGQQAVLIYSRSR